MNYLQSWQIPFTKFFYKPDSSSFRVCVISRRLKKLIDRKKKDGEWRVLQLNIKPDVIWWQGYVPVFVAPSKGTIFFIKDEIFSFSFNRKLKKWHKTF